MQVHLDPLGGVAGDMFVAALLDAWPERADQAMAAVYGCGLADHVELEHLAFRDEVLIGSRFAVSHHGNRHDGHDHAPWRDLRDRLVDAPLAPGVRDRALGIFGLLAEAEAAIHGLPVDQVTFHEVGAWDSVADIIAAAFLIDASGVESWSVGPLPLGRGTVRCAHGELPVPAPATLRLLDGFVFHDDGRPGERVTPTGAAILKHLRPRAGFSPHVGRLSRVGYGFGTRRIDGISNVLRATVFDSVSTGGRVDDRVGVIRFEIDDQTAEDLAIGLDHLRARDDVLDILQMPAFGKKGRMVTALRLLVRPEAIELVIDACLAETATIGLRWSIESRAMLARETSKTKDGVRLKRVARPDGRWTVKAESGDLRTLSGYSERRRQRRRAEEASRDPDDWEHGG